MRAYPPQGWLILETSADSYGQAIPYLPVIELLKSYFQIAGCREVSTLHDQVADKLHTLSQSLRAEPAGRAHPAGCPGRGCRVASPRSLANVASNSWTPSNAC